MTNFGLISLIAITVIGLVLGNMLRASVERQVLDGAIAEAEVVSQLGLRDIIGPRELANGLSPTRLDAVRFGLRADLAEIGVVDMVLWNLDNDVVFATDDEMIGRASPTNSEIMRAAGGRPAVRITDVSDGREDLQEYGSVVEVFQPVRFGTVGTAEVVGVLMTAIPYGPVAAAIDLEVSRLRVVLFTVFLLLYAVLFRLVANASVELRARADQNEWQARHDGLTGLPNRVLFSEEMTTELDVTQSGPIAVVLLDLDRFKEVNDTLGHHHGDLLLMEVGQRLQATLRPSDRVARFGGDEFALMLADVKDTATALVVANRIVEAIAEPFEVGGLRLDVGASLGLAMSPEHGTDLATLLQKADIAMYQAKREGSDCVLYDPDNDHHSREQLALAGELRRGMENELVVYFQPKVELEDERVCGVEALVRWNHPEHGLLPPGAFMAMAERSGLMNGLTRVVLEKTLAQLREWLDAGHDVDVAVNVSAGGLHDSGLADDIDRFLAKYGVPAERLVLEITETTIAEDAERAEEVLQTLVDRGVRVSIDDFGTGYSSLAVLRSLPVTELKIDRGFVSDLSHPEGAAIVEYSINLGHMLGLRVVAEGVEERWEGDRLLAMGCDMAQGYFFARPMPADQATAWMAERMPRAVGAVREIDA